MLQIVSIDRVNFVRITPVDQNTENRSKCAVIASTNYVNLTTGTRRVKRTSNSEAETEEQKQQEIQAQ